MVDGLRADSLWQCGGGCEAAGLLGWCRSASARRVGRIEEKVAQGVEDLLTLAGPGASYLRPLRRDGCGGRTRAWAGRRDAEGALWRRYLLIYLTCRVEHAKMYSFEYLDAGPGAPWQVPKASSAKLSRSTRERRHLDVFISTMLLRMQPILLIRNHKRQKRRGPQHLEHAM